MIKCEINNMKNINYSSSLRHQLTMAVIELHGCGCLPPWSKLSLKALIITRIKCLKVIFISDIDTKTLRNNLNHACPPQEGKLEP